MRDAGSAVSSTERFEQRFLAAACLVVAVLGGMVSLILPAIADVARGDLAVDATVTLGAAGAYVLARRGRTAVAGGVLLGVLVAGIGALVLRNASSPYHEVIVLAVLVPVFLAFTLRHYAAGVVLSIASLAYTVLHGRHDAEQTVSTLAVMLGLATMAGLAAWLREREQRRAMALEGQRQTLHDLYASVVEHAGEGIFRTTREGQVLLANPALARMLGYDDVPQFLAAVRTARDVYHEPADRDRLLGAVARHPGVPFETQWRRRDGTPMWVAVRARFVTTPQGETLQGMIEDLTTARAAREAEERLRQSERLLREAQAVVHLGSWMHDVATGRDTWSDETYRIFGIPIGTPVSPAEAVARMHPDDRVRVAAEFQLALATKARFESDYRLLLPDGQVKHVLDRARIDRDAAGRPERVVGAILDVTRMRTEQERLREAEDQNRRLLEESPLAIVRVAIDGTFLAANPAAVRIYGVPDLATLQRFNARDFYVHPEHRPVAVAAAAAEAGQFSRELQMRRPDGTLFWIRSHSRVVRDAAGAARYFEAIIEDITDQKAAEEARKELETKDREVKRLEELNRMRMDFLNTAAHDLKTPLTPLKLQMATLRVQSTLDPKQRAALELMDRSINRFHALIEAMLDAARLQAGKLKLKRASVALAPLVQEAIASFEEALRQNALQVDVRLDPDLAVDADPNKLMQVLMNLVSNAVKYTPKGGTVQVRAARENGSAHLSVRDSGLGMDAEQLSRLFQPFVRLHEGIAGTAKGTGLGLYICKGIAESHGGRIWAESEGPGHGSTFHLAWPLAMAAPAAPAPQPRKEGQP